MPVLLKSAENRVAALIEDESFGGPALAIADDAEYNTVECRLQPGDGVFMYTDGISEAQNPAGEEYGGARVMDSARQHSHLPLSGLFEALYADASGFSSDKKVEDDVCLVGFRLK
jgi:sigma-B regulation protein RsbU (phosphoserine phosphatase)